MYYGRPPPAQEDPPVAPVHLTAGPTEDEDYLEHTLYSNTEEGDTSMLRDRQHQKTSKPEEVCKKKEVTATSSSNKGRTVGGMPDTRRTREYIDGL